ncbi:MAG: MarR family winged helix-turn-helix transcriptional regulator [Candidatus Cryosericum sp.]
MDEKHSQEKESDYSAGDLQLLFRAVNKMHRRCLKKEMDSRGLGKVGQPMILFMLRNHEVAAECDQKGFSEALGVSPATVAVSIRRMEKAGLISKSTDPDDLRRNHLAITDKGLLLVNDCIRAFHDVDAGTFKGLSEEERRQLEGSYRRMIENLVAMGAQVPTFMTQEETT